MGDLSKVWVKFALSDCNSGAAITTLYSQVSPSGGGIGAANASYTSMQERLVCVDASVVAGQEGGTNPWYTADADNAVLTVYDPAGQFVTGGGWVKDPTGVKGNFGLTARYLKNGRVQGNLMYTYAGEFDGQPVEYKIKSSALNALAFTGTTFPVSARLQGKALLEVNRVSDGVTVYSDGNATFLATVVDSGTHPKTVDTFALVVYDKRGVEIKAVPQTLLQGGNVIAHP